MALLVLIGTPAAVAQSDNGTSVGTTIHGTVPEAPVGHRQPRRSDVPYEKDLSSSDVPNDKNLSSDPSPRKTRCSTRRSKASAEGAKARPPLPVAQAVISRSMMVMDCRLLALADFTDAIWLLIVSMPPVPCGALDDAGACEVWIEVGIDETLRPSTGRCDVALR
jgi:hypothetical protein